MATSSKSAPSYVPTLTEVVRPVELPRAAAVVQPVLQTEPIVAKVMLGLDAQLEDMVRLAVQSLVDKQTQVITEHLRTELESVVRQTVAQALSLPPDAPANSE